MIPSVRSYDPESLPSRIAKMVTRMVRNCDKYERDLDGAVARKRDSQIRAIQAVWWCNYPTVIDESCINSVKLERIYLTQRFCLQPSAHHKVWTRGGGKESKEGRQTVFFTPLDPFGCDAHERKNQVNIIQNKKSSLS